MAGRNKNIKVSFIGQDRGFKAAAKGASDSVDQAGKRFGGAATAVKGLIGLGAVTWLKGAAEAAAADERAQALLKLAIENSTDATQADIDKTEAWIDKTQRQTGITDDELRPALANLVRSYGDTETAQEDLNVAMDIATAKGLSVEAVTTAMAKANDGNVGALGRLNVKTKDVNGETLTYQEILEEAARTMGGATATAADTLSGKLERQKIRWDELKESAGAQAIDIFGRAAQGWEVIAAHFEEGSTRISAALEVFEIRTGHAADTAAAAITINRDYGITFEELIPKMQLSADELLLLRDADDAFLESLGYTKPEIEALRDLLNDAIPTAAQTARDKGIHPLRTGMEDLGDSTEDTTDAIRDQIDANRELVDPLFALVNATDRAKEATAKYNEVVETNGDDSQEAFEAANDLARATLDQEAAAAAYAEEGGAASIEVLRDTLEQAGLLPDAIQLIIDKYERYTDAAGKITNPFIGVDGAGIRIGKSARGGRIPGRRPRIVGEDGPEVFVPDSAGNVIPNNQLTRSTPAGGTGDIYLTVNAGIGTNGSQVGQQIVEEIRKFERANGKGWRAA